jgi:hypothetical protein
VVLGSLLVAVVGVVVLGDRTLDREGLEKALPTKTDVPGYLANRGVVTVLDPPGDDVEGRAVLTGEKLDRQCQVYRANDDPWACDGLRGMGIVGFANEKNVDSRISSLVLAYDGNGAAEKAWRAMVEQTRKLVGGAAEQVAPRAGDESVVFAGKSGSVVTMRIGSVVAQAVTHFDYGYRTGNQPSELKDPIEMWVKVQAEKIEEAL